MRPMCKRQPRRCGLEILEPRMVMTASPVLENLTRLPGPDFQYDFRLAGISEPLNRVTVEQSGRGAVGSTLADGTGRWTIDVNHVQLQDLKFEFRAFATDDLGQVSENSSPLLYRPNIVLINMDDMRADQVPLMPYLTELSATGTIFSNFVAPTSVSGPSRASLLTGLLPIHNGVLNNSATLGTYLNLDDSSTLPVWLSSAGYRTGLFGKDRTQPNVEGKYPSQDILAPRPGWHTYFAMISKGTTGYDAVFTDNGDLVSLTGQRNLDDVLADRLLNFVEDSAGIPFFAYLAPNAPHAPGFVAARHDHAYDGLLPPQGPNYLAPDLPPKDPEVLELWDYYYRQGSEALLDVDEAIEALVQSLTARRQLDNTVLLFTSDNGHLYGEHNGLQKNLFWEESIRVPFVVWDGRHRVGQVAGGLAATVDITATIAELGGATPPTLLDGVSVTPVLANPAVQVRESVLLEHLATDQSAHPFLDHMRLGVRTQSWVYQRSTEGDRHLFDLASDPYELNNLVEQPEYAQQFEQMERLLQQWLGNDLQPPRLRIAGIQPTGSDYTVPQPIRLTVVASDRGTGDSQIRTPAVFPAHESFAVGRALEPVDGAFDSSRELTYVDLTLPELTEPGLPISLVAAGRDVPGNVSVPIPVPLTFDPAPRLLQADDTGDSNSDRVTLKSTPRFVGQAEPGQRIALFSIAPRQNESRLLGTAIAGASGNWSITATFSQAGYYTIFGQKAAAANALVPSLTFLEPTSFHLLAMNANNLATVSGSPADDQILVERGAASAATWKYSLNGIVAGTLPSMASVAIAGDDGNDRLEVRGNIPSRLNGGNGDDVLVGGEGNDVLIGWRGANELRGGGGDDRYLYSFAEQQMRREFLEPLVSDRLFEEVGEGMDLLDFAGDFSIVAKLGSQEVAPYFKLSAQSALSGKIFVDNPAAIERIFGSDQSNSWTIPSNILVMGGAGSDAVKLSDAVVPGDAVDLRSLNIGADSTYQGELRFKLVATAGMLQLTRALPSTLRLELQTPSHLEMVGSLESFNSFTISGGLQLQTDTSQRGRLTVVVDAFPLSDPTLVQQGSVAASVLALTGLTNGIYIQNGSPLRFAPAAQLVVNASSLAGGVLTVSLLDTGRVGDGLRVRSRPSGALGITLQDRDVLFGDVPVGTITIAGNHGDNLRIALAPTATLAGVRALVRALEFERRSTSRIEDTRRLQVLLTDRWGASASAELTIRFVIASAPAPLAFLNNNLFTYPIGTNSLADSAHESIASEPKENFASGFLYLEDMSRRLSISPLTTSWNSAATSMDIQVTLRSLRSRAFSRSPNAVEQLFGFFVDESF